MMYRIIRAISRVLPRRWLVLRRLDNIEKRLGRLLSLDYLPVGEELDQRRTLLNHEFQVYSQHGEDGVILSIFSRIGTTDRRFIEFGMGNGRECNTANLSINFGWTGLLMDCDDENVADARAYYRSRPEIAPSQINIQKALVTTENINDLLRDNGMEGEIDLLSIDIDGNDYWIWRAINVIEPRVVIIEYNASLGIDKSLTVRYDPEFNRFEKHPTGWYHGASLAALSKLANTKGYVLIGCESFGVNAFFIRRDVLGEKLREISVMEAYYPCLSRSRYGTPAEQFEHIKQLDFDEV